MKYKPLILFQALLKLLAKELKEKSFSFVSYNTKNFANILKLSVQYNSSTFVHLVNNNRKMAEQQLREAKSKNISSLVVASLNLDPVFSKKLMNCPDFLRYQFIGNT